MTEKKLCTDLVAALAAPGFLVFKHHDESTAGVPDISVNGAARTVWVEVKYVRPDSSVEREVTKRQVQWANMRLLEHATGARALYVVYEERSPGEFVTTVHRPSSLSNLFNQGMAWPAPAYALRHFEGKAHREVANLLHGGAR